MATALKNELATKASRDDLNAFSTSVAGLRADVDATREDLKLARGELGTLIARNQDEIRQLFRLGQRDDIEFTVSSRGEPQKVGSITVELRRVNEEKNQFSLVVLVNNKRLELENRSVDEAIYFYGRNARMPFELVITQTLHEKIAGFLSMPK